MISTLKHSFRDAFQNLDNLLKFQFYCLIVFYFFGFDNELYYVLNSLFIVCITHALQYLITFMAAKFILKIRKLGRFWYLDEVIPQEINSIFDEIEKEKLKLCPRKVTQIKMKASLAIRNVYKLMNYDEDDENTKDSPNQSTIILTKKDHFFLYKLWLFSAFFYFLFVLRDIVQIYFMVNFLTSWYRVSYFLLYFYFCQVIESYLSV